MDFIGHLITKVEKGSPAANYGIRAGERLLRINGERVIDLIDYQKLTAERRLNIDLDSRSLELTKRSEDALGLSFETDLIGNMQTCKNHCIFCFIDQMPKGGRSSLRVKDDDWRMSFIMGNYVTLTNLSDDEFDRIIKRRVSPIFVSVHATNAQVRTYMMKNPTAGRLMERLTALYNAKLTFHCQIVLCKGINDGNVLAQTIKDLSTLYPYCASVAVVPVGLTRFRQGLEPLVPFDERESGLVIDQVQSMQSQCLEAFNTRFVFLSDEWYLVANRPIPDSSYYEDYMQIENGVGLLRQFEEDFSFQLSQRQPLKNKTCFTIAGGTAAHPFFLGLYECLKAYNIELKLIPIENRYFGGNVHVAGLVTGSDIISQLSGKTINGELLIPANMLREREAVFLDDIKLSELEDNLNVRIRPFRDGAELVDILFDQEEV